MTISSPAPSTVVTSGEVQGIEPPVPNPLPYPPQPVLQVMYETPSSACGELTPATMLSTISVGFSKESARIAGTPGLLIVLPMASKSPSCALIATFACC